MRRVSTSLGAFTRAPTVRRIFCILVISFIPLTLIVTGLFFFRRLSALEVVVAHDYTQNRVWELESIIAGLNAQISDLRSYMTKVHTEKDPPPPPPPRPPPVARSYRELDLDQQVFLYPGDRCDETISKCAHEEYVTTMNNIEKLGIEWAAPYDVDYPNRKHLMKAIGPFLEDPSFVHPFFEHVTYTEGCCEVSGPRNVRSAYRFGFNYSAMYDHSDLDADYMAQNKDLLYRERGRGYWAWKPRILWQRMMKAPLSHNYVLWYTDAGSYFKRDVTQYLNEFIASDDDVWLGTLVRSLMPWCKRDTFIRMGLDRGYYQYPHMTPAGFILVKNTLWARYFIGEWMRSVLSDVAVGDWTMYKDRRGTAVPNYNNFIDHRHDQSILSLLTVPDEPIFGLGNLCSLGWEQGVETD